MKNRPIFYTGGHPVGLEDFDRMSGLSYQVAKMFAKMHLKNADDAMVIWGCEISTTATPTSSVTEGYIYLKDEVYYVPAGTVSAGIDSCSFISSDSVDESVTYNDGDTENVGVDRVLNLTAGVSDYDGASGGAYTPEDLYYLSNAAPSGTIRHFEPPAGTSVADFVDSGDNVTGKGIWKGWTVHAKGRVLAGYQEGDPDYGTVGNEFGKNQHTLTADECGLFPHTHGFTPNTHAHDVQGKWESVANGGDHRVVLAPSDGSYSSNTNNESWDTDGASAAGNIGVSGGNNASQAHENRQPSRVTLIFKKD